MNNVTPSPWYQKNWQTLEQEINRIRQYLELYLNGQGEPNSSTSIPDNSTLGSLCNKFNLSPLERDILLLCLGVEIDPDFASLCGKINGNPQQNYPTLSLALSVLPNPNWSVLSSQCALQKWQLIEFAPGLTLTQTAIRIDKRILCYLLGERALDEQLISLVSFPEPEITDRSLPASRQEIVQQLIATWSQNSGSLPILQLCQDDLTNTSPLATLVCQHFEFNLGIISAIALPTNPNDIYQIQLKWQREAILENYVLLLNCEGISDLDLPRITAISLFIDPLKTPLMVSTLERLALLKGNVLSFDIPSLSFEEQKEIWQTHLPSISSELNGYIDKLATQFNLNPSIIQSACNQCNLESLNPQIEAQEQIATLETQLWNYCRTQARPRLEDLAQRLETKETWEDLILPEREKNVLQTMIIHLRQRGKVFQQWGFAGKERRGLGLSALFSGQSGTGKTMAAGVLARALNLDLYRIDLSAVVSKYIGETEKNLRRIFDAAESGGAILLFDEADALFGKRTEVRDSHDRHANVEVSYLLQRMEAYQGLAILTTNLQDAIDFAFLRRIRFIVSFPFPDAESRTQIWERIFPSQTPTKDLQFPTLGRLNIAGGNIRNIALNAAILAADTDDSVMMKHIVRATQTEYSKLNRSLTEISVSKWTEA